MLSQANSIQNAMCFFQKGSFRITKSLVVYLSVLETLVQYVEAARATGRTKATGYKRCGQSKARPRSFSVGCQRRRSSSVAPCRYNKRMRGKVVFQKGAAREHQVMGDINMDFKKNHEFEIYAGKNRHPLKFKASKLKCKYGTDGYEYFDAEKNRITKEEYESLPVAFYSLYHTYTLNYTINPGRLARKKKINETIKQYVKDHKKESSFALKFNDMPPVEKVCSEEDLRTWKNWRPFGVFGELRNVLNLNKPKINELLVWKVKSGHLSGGLSQFNKLTISFKEQILSITFQHVASVEETNRTPLTSRTQAIIQRVKAASVKAPMPQKTKTKTKKAVRKSSPKQKTPAKQRIERLERSESRQTLHEKKKEVTVPVPAPVHVPDVESAPIDSSPDSDCPDFDKLLEEVNWDDTPKNEESPKTLPTPPSEEQSDESCSEHKQDEQLPSDEPTVKSCPHTVFDRPVSVDSMVIDPPCIPEVEPETSVAPRTEERVLADVIEEPATEESEGASSETKRVLEEAEARNRKARERNEKIRKKMNRGLKKFEFAKVPATKNLAHRMAMELAEASKVKPHPQRRASQPWSAWKWSTMYDYSHDGLEKLGHHSYRVENNDGKIVRHPADRKRSDSRRESREAPESRRRREAVRDSAAVRDSLAMMFD